MRKIVVDVYGADRGVGTVVKGVCKALAEGLDFMPVFVGDKTEITQVLNAEQITSDRYEIIDTDKFISHDDPPSCIFGGCDDTSMVMAYNRLKSDDECIALLSAGNTGALLVGSICRLGLLPGLKTPALSSALPCMADHLVCLVDCGGNTDCTPEDLARFASMGNVFMQSMCGIENPRVGLLSVGREDYKGNTFSREAFKLIKELPLNFIGNVEGNDLVTGYADVIVSDGFSGNILLKNTESAGKSAIDLIDRVTGGEDNELTLRIKQEIAKVFDFNSQGGATFLGTKKMVVKMHGSANFDTACACVKQILRLEDGGFSKNMPESLKNLV